MSSAQTHDFRPCLGRFSRRLLESALLICLIFVGATSDAAVAQDIPAPAQPLPADAVRGEQPVYKGKTGAPGKVHVQDSQAKTPAVLPPSGEVGRPEHPGDDGRDRPGHDKGAPKKVYVPVPAARPTRPTPLPPQQSSGDSIVITKDPATGDRIMMTRPVPVEQPRPDYPYGQVIVNPDSGRK